MRWRMPVSRSVKLLPGFQWRRAARLVFRQDDNAARKASSRWMTLRLLRHLLWLVLTGLTWVCDYPGADYLNKNELAAGIRLDARHINVCH